MGRPRSTASGLTPSGPPVAQRRVMIRLLDRGDIGEVRGAAIGDMAAGRLGTVGA